MITINGKTYTGNNITVTNNKVYIDGKLTDVIPNENNKVEVVVTGDLVSLKADGAVSVSGSVRGNVDAGGAVNCGDVGGSVDAGGSVNCSNVGKNIDAGGSIIVKGSVKGTINL